VKGKTTRKGRVLCWGQGVFFCLLCCGFCAAFPFTVRAQAGFEPSLDDSTLEKYTGLQLVSRIHITRTYVDHEKWGFFKLGLAPIGVMDGVTIQVLSAASLTNTLQTLDSCHIPPSDTHRLELRNLEISLLSEKEPRLRAESARIGGSDVLELSHVSFSDGTASLSRATLQITGPDCGCLRWNDSGNQKHLFVLTPQKPTL
jgi:hypothetical protein